MNTGEIKTNNGAQRQFLVVAPVTRPHDRRFPPGFQENMGGHIRAFREEQNMTQEALVRSVNKLLSHDCVPADFKLSKLSGYENGTLQVSFDYLHYIADALNVPIASIMIGPDAMPVPAPA